MESEKILKLLRTAAATQMVVLILSISVVQSRLSLRTDLSSLEVDYLSYLIMTAKGSDIRTLSGREFSEDPSPPEGINPENHYDDLSQFNEKLPLLDAVGFFIAATTQSWRDSLALPGGGWARLSVEKIEEHETGPIMAAQARRDGSNSEDFKSVCEEDNDVPIYTMEVVIEDDSNTVFKDVKLRFSNRHSVVDPQYLDYCVKPGEILAIRRDGTQERRMSEQELSAEILRTTREWLDGEADVTVAYESVRAIYERQKLKVPVLQAETTVPVALVLLGLISISFGAVQSFVNRQLRLSAEGATPEGWLPVFSARFADGLTSSLEKRIASLEATMFHLYFILAAAAPIVVTTAAAAALVRMASIGWAVVAILLLSLGCVFSISSMLAHLAIIRNSSPHPVLMPGTG